jgi:rRNA-processing protein FCF1
MNVVLDANALMMPFEYKINLDVEITRVLGNADVYVPRCIVGELKRLSKSRWEAKAALQLAQKYKIVDVDQLGDKGVLEAAKKLCAYVVTNDRELAKILKNEGIKVLSLKQNHLVMEND